MFQILLACFFLAALAGAMTILHATVREYGTEILAALLCEAPPRRAPRAEWTRVRAAPRHPPVVLRVRHSSVAA